jgi:hypothetical protein
MKLISELVTEQVKLLVEEDSDDKEKKNYFIEGVFLQGNLKNRNGRVYPMEVLDKEVERYNKEYIEKNRAYGELGHPQGPTINLERVSHMVKGLEKQGDNYIGKAKIMDTPYGNIVKNLMNEGATLGVSSRGMGSLKDNKGVMEVQDDFYLATAADIVADPSAPDAFVRGVMEGVEWVMDPDAGLKMIKVADETQKQVKKMSVKQIEEQKLAIFDNYLKSLLGK